MASVGDALALLRAFWSTYKDVKANQEECRRFDDHSQLVLGWIEKECGNNVPEALQKRLERFIEYVRRLVLGEPHFVSML